MAFTSTGTDPKPATDGRGLTGKGGVWSVREGWVWLDSFRSVWSQTVDAIPFINISSCSHLSGPSSFENRQTRRKSGPSGGPTGERNSSLTAPRVWTYIIKVHYLFRTSCRLQRCCPPSTSWTSSGPSLFSLLGLETVCQQPHG